MKVKNGERGDWSEHVSPTFHSGFAQRALREQSRVTAGCMGKGLHRARAREVTELEDVN